MCFSKWACNHLEHSMPLRLLCLIWRYTTGKRSRGRFHTLLGELMCYRNWSTNRFAFTDWRNQTGEIWGTCWVSAFSVYCPGSAPQTLSFLGRVAQWRGSSPSSAVLPWALTLPMCAAPYQDEETAPLSGLTTNRGEDRTDWEMWTTEKDGQPSSSIRHAGVQVGDVQCQWSAKRVNAAKRWLSILICLQSLCGVSSNFVMLTSNLLFTDQKEADNKNFCKVMKNRISCVMGFSFSIEINCPNILSEAMQHIHFLIIIVIFLIYI